MIIMILKNNNNENNDRESSRRLQNSIFTLALAQLEPKALNTLKE